MFTNSPFLAILDQHFAVWVQHILFSCSVAEMHLDCVQIIHGVARNFVYRCLLFETQRNICYEEVAKSLCLHTHTYTYMYMNMWMTSLDIYLSSSVCLSLSLLLTLMVMNFFMEFSQYFIGPPCSSSLPLFYISIFLYSREFYKNFNEIQLYLSPIITSELFPYFSNMFLFQIILLFSSSSSPPPPSNTVDSVSTACAFMSVGSSTAA